MIGQQPTLESLPHELGVDGEMDRRETTGFDRLGIEFAFNRRSVFYDAEAGTRGEKTQIARALLRRRPIDKLRRVAFDDAVRVADAQLMLIDEQAVARRV